MRKQKPYNCVPLLQKKRGGIMNRVTQHIIWGELNSLAGFKTDNFFTQRVEGAKLVS